MDEPFMHPEADADLTRAILARTSGSACTRLRDQACAYVDGELDEIQGDLVGAHLEHCADCAKLVAALRSNEAVLPTMAEVDPGPWFTQRVLRATVHAPRAATQDFRTLWWKLLHRPRIALETAFLGAAASMLGLVVPMPARTSTLRMPALVRPVVASAQRVTGQLLQAEQRTAASLGQTFLSHEPTPSAPMSLWQRLAWRVRGWRQALWSARGKSASATEPSAPAPRSSH